MDTETAIALLKIASALIGGALGVAGLLANFHDSSGKLTRAGVAVLSGISISAVVGVITSTIEAQKDRESSLEQATRAENVLRELSRSIQPIRELKLTYWLEIPQASKIVGKYVTRLNAGIEERIELLRGSKRIELLRKGAPGNKLLKGLEAWAIDVDGEPLNIEVKPESDLWPRDDESVIGSAAGFFPISIDMFKTPITPEDYRPISGASDFGALSFSKATLDWDRKRKRLVLRGNIEFDKALWKRNGKVSSIVDLYGAQILLFPPDSMDVNLPGNLSAFRNDHYDQQVEFSRSMNIKTIALDFGEGRSFWINGKHFKKTAFKGGYPVFSVTLPKDNTEFLEFTAPRGDE